MCGKPIPYFLTCYLIGQMGDDVMRPRGSEQFDLHDLVCDVFFRHWCRLRHLPFSEIHCNDVIQSDYFSVLVFPLVSCLTEERVGSVPALCACTDIYVNESKLAEIGRGLPNHSMRCTLYL